MSKLDRQNESLTPQEVQRTIEEVGRDGCIEIKFFDSETAISQPVDNIGQIDDGGIELGPQKAPASEKTFHPWDDIEWIKSLRRNPWER